MTDHRIGLVRALLFGGSALVMLGACTLASRALGHSWYPWECCSDQDCEPITGDVEETQSGYVLPDGRTVSYRDPLIKVSADARFHWCRNVTTGRLICLFVPARGT